jgi:hypothetical protein
MSYRDQALFLESLKYLGNSLAINGKKKKKYDEISQQPDESAIR